MPTGQKHLVRCRCVLPQFKNAADPPIHQFAVFSVIEDDGNVRPRLAQCTNCGVVHRVTDLCRSEILVGNEGTPSLATIDDIKAAMPENVAGVLETNDVDLATWEAVQFIIENKRWGDFVIIASDRVSGERHGKYIRILGERLYKVESFVVNELVGAK